MPGMRRRFLKATLRGALLSLFYFLLRQACFFAALRATLTRLGFLRRRVAVGPHFFGRHGLS